MRVSVLGATGYTGFELVKMLLKHKSFKIAELTSESYIGKKMSDVYPQLLGLTDKVLISNDFDTIIKNSDAVFLCLPHGASIEATKKLYDAGKIVVDLSADFRVNDVELYESTYKVKHTATELLAKAVYGIPEIYRDDIKDSKIIASAGCYPTSIITPLYPLIKEGAVDIDIIVADSKSGVSGAGRKATETNSFCEVNEDFKPYGIFTHRHGVEIDYILSSLSGGDVNVIFTPHLLPVNRGIVSTIYCKSNIALDKINKIWQQYYGNEKLIRIRQDIPTLKYVANTPFIDFAGYMKNNKLIIVSALDNLLKGASSQALQSLNIIAGVDELEGIL